MHSAEMSAATEHLNPGARGEERSGNIDILENEIRHLEAAIAAGLRAKSPPDSVSDPALLELAMRQGKMKEDRAARLEEERVVEVRRAFEEEHPPPSQDCPLCLETMEDAYNYSKWIEFFCCAKMICTSCSELQDSHNNKNCESGSNCPFCRTPLDLPDETWEGQVVERIRACAERGDEGAQYSMAVAYMEGKYGVKPDITEAGRWLLRAGDQGHGIALYHLALFHGEMHEASLISVGIEKSADDAFRCFRASAHTSYLSGLTAYGKALMDQTQRSEAFRYFTIAAGKGCTYSQWQLGVHWYDQNVGDNNLELSKYWLEKCASPENPRIQSLLASVLSHLTKNRYQRHTCTCYANDNSLTRSILLARQGYAANVRGKATCSCTDCWRHSDHDRSQNTLNAVEREAKSSCANCYRKQDQTSNAPAPLLKCSRCKATRYCSRVCQVQHYKAAHKLVCKKECPPKPPVVEQVSIRSCANCHTKLGQDLHSPAPLLRCSRCKEVYYCTKICQVQHYKGGHKLVCKER